ncbi:MAG: YfjI family protein [Pseudomonadota bacterium]
MMARDHFDNAETFTPDEPVPLVREIPPGARYPLEALGPLRAAAEAIHDKTQAPAAIAAQSVLGVAALAVQGLADVEALHGAAPASLFLLTVAQSGERKSGCDRLAMAAVDAFEAELAEQHRDAVMAYENRLAIWQEERKRILKPPRKGERPRNKDAMRADLDALGTEPERPLFPSIVTTEPTLEGIVKNLPNLRPSLGLFTDEGGAFIGGHAMSRDNRLKTVSGLSDFWGAKAVKRWRAEDGVASFPGRRLSAHIMAQPVAADELLSDPIANGQGFLARFLMVEPASTIGTRLREGYDPPSDGALEAFSARIGDLLRRPLPLVEGTRNTLTPPLVTLSAEARAVLTRFAQKVERAQAAGGDLETTRPFASKAAEHAARIAGVLTLYADPEAGEVSGETMVYAVTLATFYLSEAQRLADAAKISAEIAEAERLLNWLQEGWGEPHVSIADIIQLGPRSIRTAEIARKHVQLLQREGWLIPVEGGATIRDKRRPKAWLIQRRSPR